MLLKKLLSKLWPAKPTMPIWKLSYTAGFSEFQLISWQYRNQYRLYPLTMRQADWETATSIN